MAVAAPAEERTTESSSQLRPRVREEDTFHRPSSSTMIPPISIIANLSTGGEDEDPSIVILNPFWARTPDEQNPRLTVKSTPSPPPPPPPPLPPPRPLSSSSPPPTSVVKMRRPPPPSSIASELLLLSHQLPPDWSDLLTMSMLSPNSAEETPVDGVPSSSSQRRLTSQSSSGSGTRRPLVKQKKHCHSAEDLATGGETSGANVGGPSDGGGDVIHPAVTINVSSSSHSPFTCPSLPSPSATSASFSSLPTATAGRRTCSFEDAVPMAVEMAAAALSATHSVGGGSGGGASGSSHHLKPSSCVARTRSPSPSSAGLRFVVGSAGVGGGSVGLVAGDVSPHSSSGGGLGSRYRASGAGSSSGGAAAGSGGSGGVGGSRQSRQQSVKSRASISIPTTAAATAAASVSLLAGHQHHQPGGSNSSKSAPIEDGAPLPAAFEPVPLNLYGKPLQEIDPTVRDKVTHSDLIDYLIFSFLFDFFDCRSLFRLPKG